jgi:hypothetical protein
VNVASSGSNYINDAAGPAGQAAYVALPDETGSLGTLTQYKIGSGIQNNAPTSGAATYSGSFFVPSGTILAFSHLAVKANVGDASNNYDWCIYSDSSTTGTLIADCGAAQHITGSAVNACSATQGTVVVKGPAMLTAVITGNATTATFSGTGSDATIGSSSSSGFSGGLCGSSITLDSAAALRQLPSMYLY